MKSFFRTRSYEIVRMFLNQFAIALFGFVLALASAKAKNVTLRNVTSAFSVLFYLFLLYTMTWELGFKDKAGVDSGRKSGDYLCGLKMSFCANLINLLLAVLIALGQIFATVTALDAAGRVVTPIALFLNGMYTGLLVNPVGGAPLNSYWWVYFLIPIPAMLTCTIAYVFGMKDIKFTGLFNAQYPESDREPKKRRK